MGVLACSRYGCENIMCDLLVEGNYVCNECAAEFRVSVNDKAMPLEQLREAFKLFMASEKPKHSADRVTTVDDFLGLTSKDWFA